MDHATEVATSGKIRITPPLGPGPPFPLSLRLPHEACGSLVLAWPGGAPPLLGHGGWALEALVEAGVGLGVGRGVGFGVGCSVRAAVGAGVGRGVGLAMGVAVGPGVGRPVDVGWLGRGVDGPAGVDDVPGINGEAVATAIVGAGLPACDVPVGDGEGDGSPGLVDALGL